MSWSVVNIPLAIRGFPCAICQLDANPRSKLSVKRIFSLGIEFGGKTDGMGVGNVLGMSVLFWVSILEPTFSGVMVWACTMGKMDRGIDNRT